MPAGIRDKPELFFGLALFLNAWFDLDTERNRTKYERITRSMCFQFADDYDLDDETKDDLWYYIHRMDTEFLGWWQRKQPRAANSGTDTPGSKQGDDG